MGFLDAFEGETEQQENFVKSFTAEMEKEGDELTKIPDGDYNVVVNKVVKKTNNGLKLVWEFIVSDGPFERKHTWKTQNFKHERSGEFLAKDLKVCGVEKDVNLDNLDEILETLTGLELKISIVTNTNGYQNTYLNKLTSNYPF